MKEYVIGIDTGATKSHLALFDTDGTLVDFGEWGPLNHEVLPGSFAQFGDEINRFVSGVLSKNNISMNRIAYSVMGIAGVDTKKQHHIISDILSKTGFGRFTLVNDAFVGIPAGNPAGTGICAINGSGCTLAGVNSAGKTLQIGGVGFLSADNGGGGHMSRQAISAVYGELFRKNEPTWMTQAMFKILGITSKYDFVEVFNEKIDDKSIELRSFVKLLFEAAGHNDHVAKKILRDVADSYCRGIACMIEELDYSTAEVIYIILAGSVFVKPENPFLVNSLKDSLRKYKHDYKFIYTVLDVPPVAGAVIWALNSLKGSGAHYDKVRSQLAEKF